MMMEEQLQEIVEYAEPKPKSFICVSGNKLRLKTTFIPSSSLDELALTSLETYYSFPNIDATNNHVRQWRNVDGHSYIGRLLRDQSNQQ